MDVKTIDTRFYNQLYHDYIKRAEFLKSYLTHYQDCDWPSLAGSVSADHTVHDSIKKHLAEQNSDLDSAAARINLERLQHSDCVMVVTGQQLGLFASPLYTVYKAMTTIRLAEKLNDSYPGLSFVPVFWMESEDHDFAEVNHIGLWDQELNPRTLIYQGRDLGKSPVRCYMIEAAISQLLEEIKNCLLPTEFSAPLESVLSGIYRAGQSWVEAARLFLKYLLAEKGILFFQPGTPAVKEISVPFFDRLLRNSAEIERIFTATSQELENRGYKNQVPVIAGKTYIHFENEARQRDHLYSEAGRFYLKDSSKKFSLAEVQKFMARYPAKISSSVISRPLLQSWLLPAAVYVAGPAEIAYWAQLGRLFTFMGLGRPVVYPRSSATLLEPKIARFIEKHRPDIENIIPRKADFIHNHFNRLEHAGAGANPVRDLEDAFKGREDEVRRYLQQVDPTLVSVGDKVLERIKGQIDFLQDKIIKSGEQKDSVLTTHLAQIHQAILPDQQLQERFISILYFLNKFGPAVLEKIYMDLQIDTFRHQLIYL